MAKKSDEPMVTISERKRTHKKGWHLSEDGRRRISEAVREHLNDPEWVAARNWKINQLNIDDVKRLYYGEGMTQAEVAEALESTIYVVQRFMKRNGLKTRATKHGGYHKEPWVAAYRSMFYRCYNPKCSQYKNYGGRGIEVCEEWRESIEAFAKWVETSNYEEGLTLDRIDVNGNYEPSNCRWATQKQQANNRRSSAYITIGNETKTIAEWAEYSGLKCATIGRRYRVSGVRDERLLYSVEEFEEAWTKQRRKQAWAKRREKDNEQGKHDSGKADLE